MTSANEDTVTGTVPSDEQIDKILADWAAPHRANGGDKKSFLHKAKRKMKRAIAILRNGAGQSGLTPQQLEDYNQLRRIVYELILEADQADKAIQEPKPVQGLPNNVRRPEADQE